MSLKHEHHRATRLGIAVATLLLLVVPVRTVAADPPTQQVGIGTPVTFSGNGFGPKESLSAWEVGPDTSVTALRTIQTDSGGAFSLNLAFPTAGQWQVVAHSTATGKFVDAVFVVGPTVGTTTEPSPPPTDPTATAPGGAAANTSGTNAVPVAVGVSATFSGTGFATNEAITRWETAPGGSVTPLSGIAADGAGTFLTSVSFTTAGQWEVTAHGTTSGKEVVGTYAVGTTSASSSAPVSAPSTTSSGVVPNSSAGTASQVAVGSQVTFSGTGYTANEAISLWETAPGGNVIPLSGIGADGKGAFTTTVTFQPVGYWQVTAQGRTSRHTTISGYTVTGTR